MRAVRYQAFGGRPELCDVADPVPGPHAAVVQVAATGVCRSDWHAWQGHDPDVGLPHVGGHELAGVVASVGPLVRGWRPGARVTVPFVCACGTCAECASGNHQVCEHQFQPGFTAWGSFAEYVAIDYADTNLVRLPQDLDYATAASLGCRFATAYRASSFTDAIPNEAAREVAQESIGQAVGVIRGALDGGFIDHARATKCIERIVGEPALADITTHLAAEIIG